MNDLKRSLKNMYLVIIVWLLSLLFSAVMFTLSLIYEVNVSLFLSIGTGIFSSIGTFYTAYIIIKIKQKLKVIAK